MKKKRKIVANLARSFEEAEEWNLNFWQKAGIQVIFSAAWTMLRDYYAFRRIRGFQQRLRRSVQNIERLPD